MKTLRKNSKIEKVLDAIEAGELKKYKASSYFYEKGYEALKSSISAVLSFAKDIRWAEQKVKVPQKAKGNLSAYAGSRVSLIITNINRNSPSFEFYIKEIR